MSEYEVGYGRPPKASRFKSGQSGNPKGRRRPERFVDKLIYQEGNKSMEVKVAGKRQRLKRKEAVVLALYKKAMEGNLSAAEFLLTRISQVERSEAAAEESYPQLLEEVFARLNRAFEAFDEDQAQGKVAPELAAPPDDAKAD